MPLIALDMDGTLTQHRTPLGEANARALDDLRQVHRLVIVGAGAHLRIHRQLGGYPVDVLGCYGMESARWDETAGKLRLVEQLSTPPLDEAARTAINRLAERIRARHGFTEYLGDSVEFHASGMLTFALLGTGAAIADKLAFDPDRSKRRAFHREVCDAFPDYTVFVGGSSSFDIVPRPFNKLYALQRYCDREHIPLDEVTFVGDDYGAGGNDEQVYRAGVPFITIDDYRDFPEVAAGLVAQAATGQR